MAIKDLASHINAALAIAPNLYSATTPPALIDLQGYQSAAVIIEVGIGGVIFSPTVRIDFQLQDSDDNVSFANVAATSLNGSEAPSSVSGGIIKSLQAAHATGDVTTIGYIGGKRYLQLTANFVGTQAQGTPLSASVIRGNPLKIPTL